MQNETTPGQAALPAAMAAKMNDHIQKLHAQLAITAAEEPQWDQYATVMRQNAADMNQAYEDRAAKLDTMNASENMQSYAHVTQVHAANMEKLANAFAPLYASFSPEQKSAADRMFQNKAEMHEHRKS
jgi:Mlc titration factor MtfA (ptsG expression regulator)